MGVDEWDDRVGRGGVVPGDTDATESGPKGEVRAGAGAPGQRVQAAARRVTPIRKSFNWIMTSPPSLLEPDCCVAGACLVRRGVWHDSVVGRQRLIGDVTRAAA